MIIGDCGVAITGNLNGFDCQLENVAYLMTNIIIFRLNYIITIANFAIIGLPSKDYKNITQLVL